MGRRKLFTGRIQLTITAEMLAQIDATLGNGQQRLDFIRQAIAEKLERQSSDNDKSDKLV